MDKMRICPFHRDENPSMIVHDGRSFCFGCQKIKIKKERKNGK